jgi:O-acetyl-ADP-ribose deacetylase
LYKHHWVIPFDWPAWHQEAVRYRENRGMISGADLETLRKLLTTHVREDRFAEGHLSSAFKSGEIVAILRRLKELREEVT